MRTAPLCAGVLLLISRIAAEIDDHVRLDSGSIPGLAGSSAEEASR